MFDYSLKVKIVIIAFFLISVAFIFLLVRDHQQKAEDLKTVYKVQLLATALEKYYAKFNKYPILPSTDLADINIISDQGINETGENVYFQGDLMLENEAYLTSQPGSYLFEFTLAKKWEVWGIDGREGGVCEMVNGLQITCKNKPVSFLDYFR